MSGYHDFSPLNDAAIEELLLKHFKGGLERPGQPLVDHVRMLVNRHVEACSAVGIAPEIDRTVIEAVEDYHLKQTTGISVLDRAPEEAEFPSRKLLQYVSPRRNEL